ncbi:MAG: methyltransferase, partial [Methanothrix sp.]|nr:methyltransferase [Methanothrix sp.]
APAVQNVLLNLEVNRKLLGIEEIEYPEKLTSIAGKEPVIVARAHGPCEIEVYHGDIKRLFSRALPAKLCLIDHFPKANTSEMEEACRCCNEIVIV